MYVPAHFKEDRVPILHDAIRKIGLASLVTCGEAGMEGKPRANARGSCARAVRYAPWACGTREPTMAARQPRVHALAIFLGPNTYISPSWYPTKQQTGKVVPTWNYLAIHAYGEINFFDDPAQLRDHVGRLTEMHEASRTSPWAITDAPADYVDKMLRNIVGFKVVITRLEGKWKMSQNRSAQDIAGVHEGLTREDGVSQRAVAEVMTKSNWPVIL